MNAIESNRTDAERRIQRLIFALSIIWYCWFLTPLPNWNVMSRAALSSSIVLDHALTIDRYGSYTGDIACYKGRRYSDKAPGASWMSLPALTAFSFKNIVEPKNNWQVFLMTLTVVSIPAALLNVLLFRYVYSIGGDMTAALAAAVSYAFGTLAFPYATLFYSHQTVALLMFILLMTGRNLRGERSEEYDKPYVFLLFGFLLGTLFTTEYPASLGGAVIAAYTLSGLRGFRNMAAASCAIAAGAAAPVLCWFAYNQSIFHTLVEFGYKYECIEEFRIGMNQGLRGFTAPTARTAYELFLLPGRGLLFLSPFLALAAPGLAKMFSARNLRGEAAVISLIILFTSVMNIAIYQPSGGAALGPRYLTQMLPFCAAAAGVFMSGKKKGFIFAALGCAAVGALQMFIGVITNPQPPRGVDAPLFSHTVPMLLDGYVRPGLLSFISRDSIVQLAPPAVLSIISFAALGPSVYSWAVKDKKAAMKLFAAFAASFAIFGSVTAFMSLRESAKLQPSVKYAAMGDTYHFLGRNELAADYAAKSLAASNGYPEELAAAGLWNVCARIYRDRKYEAAARCMDKAADVGELTAGRLISLASEAGRSGAHYDSYRILRGGAKIYPMSFEMRVEFGRALMLQKRYREALAEASAALAIRPGDKEAASLQRNAAEAARKF